METVQVGVANVPLSTLSAWSPAEAKPGRASGWRVSYCVLDLPPTDGDRVSLLSRECRPVVSESQSFPLKLPGSGPLDVDGADPAMPPPRPPVTNSGYTMAKSSPVGCAKGPSNPFLPAARSR